MSDLEELAEKLFVAQWKPHSGLHSTRVAEQCREAAAAFLEGRPKSKSATKKKSAVSRPAETTTT